MGAVLSDLDSSDQRGHAAERDLAPDRECKIRVCLSTGFLARSAPCKHRMSLIRALKALGAGGASVSAGLVSATNPLR